MPGRAAAGAGGKLTAIARRWAGARGGGDAAEDAATGSAAAAIAAIEARRAKARPLDEVEIGPSEFEAVRLFFSLGSQWRVHAMTGLRLGIDYAAVTPTAAMMGMTMTPLLFDDLTTMERAALAAFAAA